LNCLCRFAPPQGTIFFSRDNPLGVLGGSFPDFNDVSLVKLRQDSDALMAKIKIYFHADDVCLYANTNLLHVFGVCV
jgi:hypothetical protein